LSRAFSSVTSLKEGNKSTSCSYYHRQGAAHNKAHTTKNFYLGRSLRLLHVLTILQVKIATIRLDELAAVGRISL